MKKIIKLLLFIVFLGIMLTACQKDNSNLTTDFGKDHTTEDGICIQHAIPEEFEYIDRDMKLDRIDNLKNIISESLYKAITSDSDFKEFFLNSLYEKLEKSHGEMFFSEFINLKYKNSDVLTILKDGVRNNISWENELSQSCDIFPNLVISLPFQIKDVIDEYGLMDLEYNIIPTIKFDYRDKYKFDVYHLMPKDEINLTSIQRNKPFCAISIQIKESEYYYPIKKESGEYKTIWGDKVSSLYWQLERCPDLINKIEEFTINENCNSEYSMLDFFSFRSFVSQNCVIKSPISNRTECIQEPGLERDCVTEKNVIEGLIFTSSAVLFQMLNQAGGESIINLVYTFHTTELCEPYPQSGECSSIVNTKMITEEWSEFFNIVKYKVTSNHPTQGFHDVLYVIKLVDHLYGPDKYLVAVLEPIYYDIRSQDLNHPEFTQFPIFDNSTSTWDGNAIGDRYFCFIKEQDHIITSSESSYEIETTNKTSMSLDLSQGEVFNGSYSFDASIKKTSKYSIKMKPELDVPLGDWRDYYQTNIDAVVSDNSVNYYKSTGVLATHLAFYY